MRKTLVWRLQVVVPMRKMRRMARKMWRALRCEGEEAYTSLRPMVLTDGFMQEAAKDGGTWKQSWHTTVPCAKSRGMLHTKIEHCYYCFCLGQYDLCVVCLHLLRWSSYLSGVLFHYLFSCSWIWLQMFIKNVVSSFLLLSSLSVFSSISRCSTNYLVKRFSFWLSLDLRASSSVPQLFFSLPLLN